MPLRIANGAGFFGDWLDAPRRLVEAERLDYLTLEYLAELTLAILAQQKKKNPSAGYAGDFSEVLQSLTPALAAQPQLRIVTNAGGLNPTGCAAAAANILCDAGLGTVRIAVVTGDDLVGRLDELQAAGCTLAHLDTGEPLAENAPFAQPSPKGRGGSALAANVYLGAGPIVEALTAGARIVITGRVADASLCVGPAVHEFGWAWDNWDALAAGSVAGHLIECGAQVTGGYSTRWQDLNLAEAGYPIAELAADGGLVITKPAGTGGAVNRRTVTEQLLYEVGDPAAYLTPDVTVDFTGIQVEEVGENRVAVRGTSGRPAPDDYKAALIFADGWAAEGELLVYGPDCVEKARESAKIVFERLRQAGIQCEQTHTELLGAGAAHPGNNPPPESLRELVLRLAVRDPRREAVERFCRGLAPLITSGPAGLAGYARGRPRPRQAFTLWPTLVPKDMIEPRIETRPAEDWKP